MKIFHTIEAYREWRCALPSHLSVGFVPTMGCLHAGHAALIEEASAKNDVSVLSIYVNPTQFNDASDLKAYPKTIEKDLKLAKSLDVSAVFMPTNEVMYPSESAFTVTSCHALTQIGEGQARPGHFDGVLTVVMKLFQIVQPNQVYFGEKDYQQCALIRAMIADYFMPIYLHAVPTVREASGLAMSSRNTRLDPEARIIADKFATLFNGAAMKSSQEITEALQALPLELEYLDSIDNRLLVAVKVDGVRLIDNRKIEV